MPYSREKNLLFIHIPKNAGKFIEDRYSMSDIAGSESNQKGRTFYSNLSRAILKLDRNNQEFAKENIRRMIDIGLVGQHMTLMEMQLFGLVPRDTSNLNLLVSSRSPYTRAISLYSNIRERRKWEQSDFEDFCRYWTKTISSKDKHITLSQKRLQSDYLINIDGLISKDMTIVRVENLESDLIQFEKVTNIKDIYINKKPRVKTSYLKPKLTDNAIKFININYAKDFDLLKYNKE